MRHDYYILNGTEVVPAINCMAWAEFFEHGNRRVRLTRVRGYEVSTVFLGNNHAFDDGPPMIFECMVFGDTESYFFAGKQRHARRDVAGERCSTYAQAVAMHKRMVKLYRMSPRQLKRWEERNAQLA